MLDLTSTSLLAVLLLAATCLFLLGIVVAVRRPRGKHGVAPRAVGLTAVFASVVVLSLVSAGVALNREYLFYTSWDDLAGEVGQNSKISTEGLVGDGQGRVVVVSPRSSGPSLNRQTLVWLPEQYDDPAYRNHRFRVVMFMPGQPGQPDKVFTQYNFGEVATDQIDDGRTAPFIAVFPTIYIAPPRDTECTDIKGSTQALTWLSEDVPAFVADRYRVQPPGHAWTAMGWSTGGFCAGKLVARHPETFGNAVSFGGYYEPLLDSTTGDLFGGDQDLSDQNSMQFLYRKNDGLRGGRLLMVVGRQDQESWDSTRKMIATAKGDADVQSIVFPQGGHNFRNYNSYLDQAIRWSGRG